MIKLEDKSNVNAPSVPYPYGSLRNNPGDNTGTPVNVNLVGDVMQLMEKIMAESGITPNGLPDNEANGWQLFEALRTVGNRKYVKEVTSDFDGDIITITRSEITTAFGGTPFGSGYFGTGTSSNPIIDFQIQIWYQGTSSPGLQWNLVENVNVPVFVNATTGDITLTFNLAPVSPDANVRIILIG